jgi:hypothetical protein
MYKYMLKPPKVLEAVLNEINPYMFHFSRQFSLILLCTFDMSLYLRGNMNLGISWRM